MATGHERASATRQTVTSREECAAMFEKGAIDTMAKGGEDEQVEEEELKRRRGRRRSNNKMMFECSALLPTCR